MRFSLISKVLLLAGPLAAFHHANCRPGEGVPARPARVTTLEGVVTTVAGLADKRGNADGPGTTARFSSPYGLAVDAQGTVYVANLSGNTIRKISPTGTVTTLAGLAATKCFADGAGDKARFYQPYGIAIDAAGTLYATDEYNAAVRKITAAGQVTTLAGRPRSYDEKLPEDAPEKDTRSDGQGSAGHFYFPAGIAVDAHGTVYVADPSSNTVRKITPSGRVSTLAGKAGEDEGSADGTAAARFASPEGIAVGPDGDLYVTDRHNSTIRKISPSGVVTTWAGTPGRHGSTNGPRTEALFNDPNGIAVAPDGTVYVANSGDYTIRRISPSGIVSTLAGQPFAKGNVDGTGDAARFVNPYGLAVAPDGRLYVSDRYSDIIRVIR